MLAIITVWLLFLDRNNEELEGEGEEEDEVSGSQDEDKRDPR